MARSLMKYWLYIGWIILVTLVATLKYFWGTTKTTPAWAWQASKDFKALHQLKKTDLIIPDSVTVAGKEDTLELLIGHHLLHSKKRGEAIRSIDVSPFPTVTNIPKNYVIGFFNLNKEELPLMTLAQEGSWVAICSVGQPEKKIEPKCSDSLQVLAVHTPNDSTDNAFWLLQLTASRSNEISHFMTEKNRYILIK